MDSAVEGLVGEGRRHRSPVKPEALESILWTYSEAWEGKCERVIDLGHALIRAGPTYGSVMRLRLPSAIEACLDDLTAQVETEVGRCLWWIGPTTLPGDLGDCLVRRGFTVFWEFEGLVLDNLTVGIPRDPEIVIEPLSWDTALAYAMGCTDTQDPDWQRYLLESAHRYLESTMHDVQIYVARLGGEVAGYAVLRIEPAGIAYLANALTVKEFRRRGVYSALTAHRLAAARAAGCHSAVIIARSDTSAPIVRKYGFSPVCRFLAYLPPRPASRVAR